MRNQPCFCGSGKKAKHCHQDIQSESAFASLIQLQTRIDQEIESNKGNVLCKKGCSSCCYEPFSINSTEFFFIMNYILKQYGAEKAKEVIEKGYQIWEEIEGKYPTLADKLKKNLEGQDFKALQLVYETVDGSSSLKYPCPFLDETTQSCTVYEARPLICRTYGVGYVEKMEKAFQLCVHIPNGLDYQENNMIDLTEYDKEFEQWIKIFIKDYGYIYERPYPIFYFMKLQHQYPDVMPKKILELKQHSLEQITRIKLVRMKNRTSR